MTAPVAPAVAELAGRLRIASGKLARRGTTGADGMTPSRLAALAVLETEGPMRIGALAERVGISAPTTSRLVDCLAERGLIERTPDPHDHRAVHVGLSGAGAAGLAEVRRRGTGHLADRIAELDPQALAVLLAALPVLEAISG